MRFVGSLPACRRLPNESVDFVKPFYDFDFAAYVAGGSARPRPASGHGGSTALATGRPLALTDPDAAITGRRSRSTTRSPSAAAKVVERAARRAGPVLRLGDGKRDRSRRPTSA